MYLFKCYHTCMNVLLITFDELDFLFYEKLIHLKA